MKGTTARGWLWTLACKPARERARPLSLSAVTSTSSETETLKASERVQLGRILTDEKGRLIVVGGPGKSGSPISRGLDNFAITIAGMTEYPTAP